MVKIPGGGLNSIGMGLNIPNVYTVGMGLNVPDVRVNGVGVIVTASSMC